MNSRTVDVGDRFGNRTVIAHAETAINGNRRVVAECDCGRQDAVLAYALRKTKMCPDCRRDHNFKRHGTRSERFWKRVEKTHSCWLWSGARNEHGYGKIRLDGKYMRAHRLSWELHYGDIPEGLYVLHKCDNPPCVRPSHLFLGTMKENSTDMIIKGRQDSGLSAEDVSHIRQLSHERVSQRQVAKMYGITQAAVHNIIHRKTWAHI